jgi:hypothetical protein
MVSRSGANATASDTVSAMSGMLVSLYGPRPVHSLRRPSNERACLYAYNYDQAM